MAEEANFALNLQNVPSIFEISASEVLDNLIYPALSKICDYVGLKLDFSINKTLFSEDISPVITFCLQYLYLKKRGGSFGESFYGLQRVSAENRAVLSHQKQVITASLLTFIPYFERKLKQRSAQHEEAKWEEYLLKIWNVYNAARAVHTFLYLTKNSASHSPIFKILGLTLRYPKVPPKEDKTTFMILKSLEVMAFFLQFIQWWYSNNQRQKIGGLQNPEPLQKTNLEERQHPTGTCPICLQKIANPTACAVSGYVYCWKCIANQIKEMKKCPVTGFPIGIDDLVRIYESC